MKFEQVIGLEVHCELKTESKMFSSSPVTFGKEPNTMVNEVDMSMPGVLPVLNKRVVEYAIRVCHALHMEMMFYVLIVKTIIMLIYQKDFKLHRINVLLVEMVI